jgi:predicted RNA-binding protein with PUA-like domain
LALWIFKSNPELFELDERLQDTEPHTTWKISRYKDEIQIGDLAFIWRTGPKRGIVAVMEITSKPQKMYELEREQKYWKNRDTELIIRVEGDFKCRCNFISYKELKQTNGLENLSVFHGFQQQTNFRVNEAEGNILMKIIKAEMNLA